MFSIDVIQRALDERARLGGIRDEILRDMGRLRTAPRDGIVDSANDSAPTPSQYLTHCGRLGEILLSPLGYCGRKWQLLNAQPVEGSLQKIGRIAIRVILAVAIIFALIPGVIGSLIKSVANSPLRENGNFKEWELSTSQEQRAQCQIIGMNDFNQAERRIGANSALARNLSQYREASHIDVSKQGDAGRFSWTVTLPLSGFGYRPIQRPNGDDFFRNIANSFRPESPSPIALTQIKVLTDLLLGIRSGTNEDYRILQEHLASSTKIQFTVHCLPEPRNDAERESLEFLRRIDLKIFY